MAARPGVVHAHVLCTAAVLTVTIPNVVAKLGGEGRRDRRGAIVEK